MPRRPSFAVVALISPLFSGCRADIAAPHEAAPVIQSLLRAGDTVQTAWVEWRVPADSGFGIEVRPVDPALVQLFLVLPDSSTVAFTPSKGVPGRFEAPVTVRPGERYSLGGTVTGISVSAEATVPGRLDIREPSQDTVIVVSSCGFFCDLPFRWFAAEAGAYLYTQLAGAALLTGSTRDTTGILSVYRSRAVDTLHLTVLAVEEHAASFLTLKTPKSSITGVFGLFGAATRAERWIIWQ